MQHCCKNASLKQLKQIINLRNLKSPPVTVAFLFRESMEETLSIKQVADYLQMDYQTVFKHRFRWGFFRMEGSNAWRITKSDLEKARKRSNNADRLALSVEEVKTMSIYKRKKSDYWWVDIATPSGQRIRRSTGTNVKKQAQEYHDKLKAEMWEMERLDIQPEYLFEEALLLYIRSAEGQSDTKSKKRFATYWRDKFSGRALSSLTTQEIINHIPTKKQNGKPLAPATQNKYIKALCRMLNLAHKSGYINKVPYVQKKKEPPIRVRWITKDTAKTLIDKLSSDWMKSICSFALLTGARRTEILTMTWDKIDFERKVAIVSNDVAKSEKARSRHIGQNSW